MKPISASIHNRIDRKGRGWVFSAKDFLDLGSRAAVDQTLSRMARNKKIRRLARGLYDFPKTSDIVGVVPPSGAKVAAALSRKIKNGLQVTPAAAANSLGLSTQVPAKPVYLTTGMTRTIKVGNVTVSLKKTAGRKMSAAGDSGTVLLALYGAKGIPSKQTALRLRGRFTPRKLARIRGRLGNTAPKWMVDVIDRAKDPKRG